MICSRCAKHASIHLTSIMNRDEICLACNAEERQHPLYAEAQLAELAASEQGEDNFAGLFADKRWEQIRELHPVSQM